MNGPEHYQEAERLLVLADEATSASDWQRENWTRQAQVHATLAQAAATGLLYARDSDDGTTYSEDAWERVASCNPNTKRSMSEDAR